MPERHSEPDAGPVAELRSLIREFGEDETLMAELQAQFAELRNKVRAAVPEGQDWIDPQDPVVLRDALASIEPLLDGGGQK
jgi:hypothetical protein